MAPLSVTVQTTYAELVEQLVALEARRSIGHAPGTFVTKTLKRGTYVYFQHSVPGGSVRQEYLGPKSPALDALMARYERERDDLRADRDVLRSLCAVLRAGGAGMTDGASARVLSALADAGVFKLGGVLVGTQAFVVLGNVLGVRWSGAQARTEDVDVAAERTLEVALGDLDADVPATLESLGMGFLPVPALSPKDPSTSFKVRGRGLRLDLLTPARGDAERGRAGRSSRPRPVPIPRLHAAATPLRFLDYLIEGAQPAAVVDGGGVLVNVPDPSRFAVHKLLVAQERSPAFQVKATKDVRQAALVIETLDTLRPGDVEAAVRDAARRGKAWKVALDRGAARLAKESAPAAALVRSAS